jgi:lysophospholipid acyltransferase (LPLAT)-like uncharacterized protein
VVAKVWLATLRVRILSFSPPPPAHQPWIYSFFHGQQFALLAYRKRKPTAVMVSLSKDGEIQSGALSLFNFRIVRGSTSRQAVRALAAMVRALRKGDDAAFALDGPKGPYGTVHPGAYFASLKTEAWLIPMACASRPVWVFRKAWDRYELPLPFSRVTVVLGIPLRAKGYTEEEMAGALKQSLELQRKTARLSLRGTIHSPPTLG